MEQVFEKRHRPLAWTLRRHRPEPLRLTSLPLPSGGRAGLQDEGRARRGPCSGRSAVPGAVAGPDFAREDNLDSDRFNRVLCVAGMKGDRSRPCRTSAASPGWRPKRHSSARGARSGALATLS